MNVVSSHPNVGCGGVLELCKLGQVAVLSFCASARWFPAIPERKFPSILGLVGTLAKEVTRCRLVTFLLSRLTEPSPPARRRTPALLDVVHPPPRHRAPVLGDVLPVIDVALSLPPPRLRANTLFIRCAPPASDGSNLTLCTPDDIAGALFSDRLWDIWWTTSAYHQQMHLVDILQRSE
ncbi:hypothetical protein B0H11DRAFT_1916659 [Mycena galericulata]|nr:hypothetical protein B0H11DRAFT_1916659 [Mycena galericulata]